MAVILVAGASKGIGQAAAARFSAGGHTVYGTGRQPLAEPGITILPMDVADDASILAAIQRIYDAHQRLDIMVNCVGYDLYGAAEDTRPQALHAQMDANFFGAVRLSLAVLPLMRAQGSGRMIHLSSVGGEVALPFNSAYAASKFALEGYFESVRYE
jgi:NAD(P)-dependent dehydrogenase (short-subunit alcohol dehydrogenase family)